ncbi:MAG: hypothetical protein CMJ77_12720 [Planctomycetaceae bacterium]|nr:hypothetical protein [Planctomycetaceae bacterium]
MASYKLASSECSITRTGHREEESSNGLISARENSEKTIDSCKFFNPELRFFRYDRFSQRNSIEPFSYRYVRQSVQLRPCLL